MVYDQFEDKRVGLRMCTFTSEVQDLGYSIKVNITACTANSCILMNSSCMDFQRKCQGQIFLAISILL